jgi:hypothetical protein
MAIIVLLLSIVSFLGTIYWVYKERNSVEAKVAVIGTIILILGSIKEIYDTQNDKNVQINNNNNYTTVLESQNENIEKELLLQSLQELRNSKEYLLDVRDYVNLKSDKIPIGKIKYQSVLKLIEGNYELITKNSSGEEKYIYQLILKLKDISDIFENCHTREDYKKWNSKYEMTIDDIAFFTGFLSWYMNCTAKGELTEDEIHTLGWDATTTQFVTPEETKNLKMRYFVYENLPITDYMEFLASID